MRSIFLSGAPRLFSLVGPVCLVLASGCGDSEIKTYRVAKEDNSTKLPPASAHSADDGHDHGAAAPSKIPAPSALPKLTWALPKGWQELPPDRMRKAAFQIAGPEGKMAQVVIIPLPGASNIELESVNMWREELGLPGLTKNEVTTEGTAVQLGDAKGHLFEMANTAPKAGQTFKTRTLGAIAERENILWFVKMTGEDQLVAEQKPAFVSFLRSIGFAKTDPSQLAATERPVSTNAKELPAGADAPKLKIPANWKEKPPGPMITAAYAVAADGGQADISISKFPGDVGGLAANINRWRGQLGLAPLGEAEARGSAKMLEVDGKSDAYMVDLTGKNARTGKPARMVALGVPRAGDTWFYKLLGDDVVVGQEKEPFLKFVLGAY
ncbi:MAG TPA: hypothetical protein VK633_01795 [Verrucomicrobiae bacterium]|nr:hypothetical protein [Verrucomicrobiae bacterium]